MRLLIVMLKEPIAGQVKTRLGTQVGNELATDYYKVLVEVLLKQLQGLSQCRIRFCFTPDDADDAVRFWLLSELEASLSPDNPKLFHSPTHAEGIQEIDFCPQGAGSYGERIQRATQQGFDDGFKEVALIHSDCPECGARWINAAFSALTPSSNNLVLGPNQYGNYYLIILSAPHSELLADINWDDQQAFTTLTTHAQNAQIKTKILPELPSVITQGDWEKVRTTPLNAAIKKRLGEDLGEMTV